MFSEVFAVDSIFIHERWRREGDSNPRYAFTYARFPSVCLKPLNHLSNLAAKIF